MLAGSRGGALSRLRRARSDLAGETLDDGDSRTSGILPAPIRVFSAMDLRWIFDDSVIISLWRADGI